MSSSRWSGKTLGGRYQIEELLGQGGMSAVYKATDPNLNRSVAVKLIHPHLSDDAEFVGRFRKEAAVVAQLRHPNIVQVFDFNRDDDDFYMVMEFVAGQTLYDRLSQLTADGEDMELADVIKYTISVCEAADYAHQRSLIHRDIKPANIMLDLEDRAILMDFGIAKIEGGAQHTATGATLGTALYMAPEQIRGERIDERSDIYSIGVMLYEMICSQPPFQAESPMTVLMMHLTDPVPDLNQLQPDCPPKLKFVVEKAMAKDRDERFQSASEMNTALHQALEAMQGIVKTSAAVAVKETSPGVQTTESDVSTSPQAESPVTANSAAAPPDGPLLESTTAEEVSEDGSKKRWAIAGGLLLVVALILIGAMAVVIFVLTGSRDEDGQVVAEAVLTEETLDFVPAASTETPTNEPTAAATATPTDTPAPTATSTATSLPEPSPTPAPRRMGQLAFLDNEQARAGSFQMNMGEASSPAAGSHYELWVSDGQDTVFLGILDPGSGNILSGEGSENLLALYDSAFITIEPDDHNGGAPSGEIVFAGFVSPTLLERINLLVSAAPDSPEEKGYLVGADEQTRLAADHGGFMLDSLAASDLASAKLHAEHVFNILAGEENSAFGDLNGDGMAQNPGDGFGLIAYLEKANEHVQLAAEADGASAEVIQHAEHSIIGSDNALVLLEEAIRATGRVLASDSVSEAQLAAETLNLALDAMLNGADANDDGMISPTPGEGGILIAYEHALRMATFDFFSAQDVATGND